jgi:hypothetical protein
MRATPAAVRRRLESEGYPAQRADLCIQTLPRGTGGAPASPHPLPSRRRRSGPLAVNLLPHPPLLHYTDDLRPSARGSHCRLNGWLPLDLQTLPSCHPARTTCWARLMGPRLGPVTSPITGISLIAWLATRIPHQIPRLRAPGLADSDPGPAPQPTRIHACSPAHCGPVSK